MSLTPTQKVRGGAGCSRNALSCGEDLESWQKEIAARPLGTLPSSGPNQGLCGKVFNWNEQDPGGLSGRDLTPPRDGHPGASGLYWSGGGEHDDGHKAGQATEMTAPDSLVSVLLLVTLRNPVLIRGGERKDHSTLFSWHEAHSAVN